MEKVEKERQNRFFSAAKKTFISRPTRDKQTPYVRPISTEVEHMRLHLFLSRAGVASRRKAEEIILQGRVQVNGKEIDQLGVQVSPKDKITVDGERVQLAPYRYLLLYKPRGMMTTTSDPQGRPTVYELLPKEFMNTEEKERLFSVGRLDFNTEGILLLTNDGNLASRLMHPRYEFPKEYEVKARGQLTEEQLEKLHRGVISLFAKDKRQKLSAKKISDIMYSGGNTRMRITLIEGKNRQIHRMLEGVGSFVVKLTRVKYGPLTLRGLEKGEFRWLEKKEVEQLYKVVGLLPEV